MNRPVHHDVETVLRRLQSLKDLAHEQGLKKARTDGDRRLVEAQYKLLPVEQSAMRWQIEQIEQGSDEDVLAQAFGGCIGGMIATLARNTGVDHVQFANAIFFFAGRTVQSLLSGSNLDGAVVQEESVPGTVGGNA